MRYVNWSDWRIKAAAACFLLATIVLMAALYAERW